MPAADQPLWHSIAIERDIAALEAEWRGFEETALATPYQAYGWVRPFVETVGAAQGSEFRYALLRDERGSLMALLPLAVTRQRGISHGVFIGDKHSNYHMGLYAPGFASQLDAERARRMLQEVAAAIGLDALVFLNQPCSWQGIANPAALIATGPSPSRAYKLALVPGDGEATLKRAMSSHARKKLKNKHNRFKDFGPSTLIHATTPEEIERILDAFLAQKAERFRSMGVADPFAEHSVRCFLTQAATASAGHRPVIRLYALELNGNYVATYIGAVRGGRFSGMATSFDLSSPTVRTSPGEILLSELIRLQSREGMAVFDLGVGEARYKTSFCDEHDDLVDTFVPLTFKGQLFTAATQARRALKRRIKSSPAALKLAQLVAARLRGRSAVEED
jgi:CelD/BcsL family acetyltransferase involved in cellulose biosynthesis